MAEYTKNLSLLKKDPVEDAKDTFNIQTMLNDNWDKIDNFCDIAAKIATGSYVGEGTATTIRLSFNFPVKFLLITGFSNWAIFMPQIACSHIFEVENSLMNSPGVRVEENDVLIDSYVSSGTTTYFPLFFDGVTYNYVAIG